MKANIYINGDWRVHVRLINIVPYEGKFMVIFEDEEFVNPEYCIVDLKDIVIL